jgi:homoserine O-succinyltransferase/O-acetyltransferase
MIVALVNNMPDSAFLDTEEQFRSLTTLPSGEDNVDLALYTITEIPRSDAIASVIQSRYRGLDQLWTHVPDALIVTGTEPAQAQLPYEPYWPYLARLLEWAASSVPTTMLSCLAAHASVLLFDGIERVPRRLKCSGVYQGPVENPADPLVAGLPVTIPIPHSRMNDVPEDAILAAGYEIVIGSGDSDVGWSVAARQRGDGRFVLCQGHPEYGTLSLLREYRRDVRRSLFGRGAVPYPRMPEAYFGPEALATLGAFERRAKMSTDDPLKLWERFPYEEVAAGVENSWVSASTAFYANWLGLARQSIPA